jgi:hypothetical protein
VEVKWGCCGRTSPGGALSMKDDRAVFAAMFEWCSRESRGGFGADCAVWCCLGKVVDAAVALGDRGVYERAAATGVQGLVTSGYGTSLRLMLKDDLLKYNPLTIKRSSLRRKEQDNSTLCALALKERQHQQRLNTPKKSLLC